MQLTGYYLYWQYTVQGGLLLTPSLLMLFPTRLQCGHRERGERGDGEGGGGLVCSIRTRCTPAGMVFRHCLQFDPFETSLVHTATHHFSCAHVPYDGRPAAEAIRPADAWCGWFLCTKAWFYAVPMGQPTLLRGSPFTPPGDLSQSGWQRMMLALRSTAIIRGAAEAWQQIDGATDGWSSAWHVVQCRARASAGVLGRTGLAVAVAERNGEPQGTTQGNEFHVSPEKPACTMYA